MAEFGTPNFDLSPKSSEIVESETVRLQETLETPYHEIHHGKVYDMLEADRKINIAAFGDIHITIDEQNLSLEKLTSERLTEVWEKNKETWKTYCKNANITLEPFEVYKYYCIQRKVLSVLGLVTNDITKRNNLLLSKNHNPTLSEMKGLSMCSEVSILACYIAQKLGEQARLVIGSVILPDSDNWREAHAYVWLERLNTILDITAASSADELPALMIPTHAETFDALENGYDVECQRLGTSTKAIYGLEAGGFNYEIQPFTTEIM
jgi:hypothetical protein